MKLKKYLINEKELNDNDYIVNKHRGIWYHQTSKAGAIGILERGFEVYSGGDQKYTEGIYLLYHSEGRFGDITFEIKVVGNFLDLSNDNLGKLWLNLKKKYWKGNWKKLTDSIKKDFPKAQGIILPTILVAWYPDKVFKEAKIIKGSII